MRKFLFSVLCFTFLSAQSQTVDEVIQKYSAALGGLDAFNAIKTAKISGNVSVQGTELPITIQVINGKAMRNDVVFMGQSITNSYKDGKGWKVNPLAGVDTPTDATGDELIELKNQSMLASSLMDYKARGNQVELQGQEDVEGVKTFKIKLSAKDGGKVTTYYIGASDYLLIKTTEKKELQGQELELDSYYSDYKEFGGVKFAMTRIQKIETQVIQQITFTSFELNVPVDEKIFDKP